MPSLAFRALGAALLAAYLAAPAAAQQSPPLKPTRDYSAAYTLTTRGNSVQLEIAYSAALQRQRTAMGEQGVILTDQRNGRMTMLNPRQRMAIEMPQAMGGGGVDMGGFTDFEQFRFERAGTDRVAGQPCTVWRVSGKDGRQGTFCVHEAGVLLRGEFGNDAQRGMMEATRVTFETQPASLFEVPEGYQRMQMPMPPGAAPPGAAQPGARRP